MAYIKKNNFVLNAAANENVSKKKEDTNWLKNKEDAEFYNSRKWRGLSLRYKMYHPVCESDNCTQASYYTDHIIPISNGGERWEWANFQALCKRCNAIKTSKQSLRKNKYS
tara:strand:- start:756 stop:1088 length:333 start_codon:yes stop_codon:yes gene_type:complete